MNIIRHDGDGRASEAVVHNGTLYLAGETCGDRAGIKAQTEGVLEKVDHFLNLYGTDKNHVLSVTIYVKDMEDFAAMNEVWDAWVENGHEPARACVEAKMAREQLLVEMSVVAAMK